MRRPILIVVILFFVVIPFACIVHRSGSYSSGTRDELKVRREIDLTSDVTLKELKLNCSYSSITIVSGPSVSKLHLTGHLREITENEANIEFTETGPRIVSKSDPPARFDGITLEIPAGIDVDVVTSSGSVTASKLAATKRVLLKSSYGSLSLTECEPIQTIKLHTSSGSITVEKIKNFHELDAHSNYGSVTIADVRGDDAGATVKANTSSGSVTVKNVGKCELVAASSYGAVTLESAAEVSAVSLKTSSGHVRASSVQTSGDMTLQTSYGAVEMSGVSNAPKLSVHSGSGHISAEKVNAGEAAFSTGYGHISLEHCAFGKLSTKTSSGKISQQDVQVKG